MHITQANNQSPEGVNMYKNPPEISPRAVQDDSTKQGNGKIRQYAEQNSNPTKTWPAREGKV